jgi:lysylphosphatidylglycerol synthetase-like protein (DUF2156 family)
VRFVGVRLVALLVAFVGSVNLLTSVRPGARLAGLAVPFDGGPPGRAQALVAGVLLIAVARGILARHYAAWLAGTVALAGASMAAIPHRFPAALLAALGVAGLVAYRHDFVTRTDPARLRQAAWIGAVGIVSALVAGGWDLVVNSAEPVDVGHDAIGYLATGAPATWRALVVAVVVAGCLTLAVLVAFRPGVPPPPGTPDDRMDVMTLSADGEADSLAPFATRSDKAYVFSPDRRAVIGYRVLFGTALAGGDPVGRATSAGAAIEAFVDACTRHGWRPAVLGASDAIAPLWRRHGLRGLHIGDEAVLPVDSFSLASRRMRNVRQAVNRTRNAGINVTIDRLSPALAGELRPILDHWLGGRRERGFAMNLDAILAPRPDCLFAVAYAAGNPVAFARFAVAGGGAVYTLDVAPRGADAPNGVAERMIVEVVEYARAHGGREVSLNFAAYRWVFGAPDVVSRSIATALHAFDRWIEIESLNRFCTKFQPEWRARALLTPSWAQFGWVVAAAVRAELIVPRPRRADDPLPRPRYADARLSSAVRRPRR